MSPIDLEAGTNQPFNAAAADANKFAKAKTAPMAAMPSEVFVSGDPGLLPGQPSPVAYAALGLTAPQSPLSATHSDPRVTKNPMSGLVPDIKPEELLPTTAPTNPADPAQADAAARRIGEYEASIQRSAEESYAWALHRSMMDPNALDVMLSSQNPIDRKLAEKILERNSEHFGAGSLDEYLAKKTIDDVGSDPRDRKLAEIELNQKKILKAEDNRRWSDWKKENGVKNDEFGKLCDSVRSEYTSSPEADIISIARGRAGIKSLSPSMIDGFGAPPIGSRGSPHGSPGDSFDPSISREFGLNAGLVRAATGYFEAIGR